MSLFPRSMFGNESIVGLDHRETIVLDLVHLIVVGITIVTMIVQIVVMDLTNAIDAVHHVKIDVDLHRLPRQVIAIVTKTGETDQPTHLFIH